MAPIRVAVVSTGGTIEKTYDELEQVLQNKVNVLDMMMASLELTGVDAIRVPLMNKDSLEMNEADHELIAQTALALGEAHEGVVIVHGTDTLEETGEAVVRLGPPRVPVVLTGAMRPYELRTTDAVQNVTEALLAVQLLPPGTYLALHNRVLRFPGVRKDRERGIFVGEPVRPGPPAA